MDFVYELAKEEDLDCIDSLMQETARKLGSDGLFVSDDKMTLARHIHIEGEILVARCCDLSKYGAIAAFLVIRFPKTAPDNLGIDAGLEPLSLSKVVHMESVIVKESYRGQGLQQKLIQLGEKLAFEQGYSYSMCTVSPENQWSLSNMLKSGYTIAATVPKYNGLMRHILIKNQRHALLTGTQMDSKMG